MSGVWRPSRSDVALTARECRGISQSFCIYTGKRLTTVWFYLLHRGTPGFEIFLDYFGGSPSAEVI